MAKIHFRPYTPNQTVLFPQRIDEDIAENDPIRMVDAFLDPETERTLIARLRRHAAGRTLLFVTHHPALAAECDATLRL
ncbi:hypothetical protein [Bacteroides togonis]|uniref:hypothetical protein n=1 Tax=Bacteroides togonis TaxID=1917883 RepID=UPI00094B72D9|nr:hypothetical protein [Bacteroides togonis]